jgi:hypothetical protein
MTVPPKEKQPLSCRFLREQNTGIPLRLAHPERIQLSLPVKSVKARFRYSPLRSETGMTVGFSSVYVGKTALVMPVIAPAKYRIPLCPAHPERIRLFIAREKRKSEIPVFSTLFRNRNDSGVLIGLRGKNSHVMPVIAPAKYRYPAVPCASREIPALRCP